MYGLMVGVVVVVVVVADIKEGDGNGGMLLWLFFSCISTKSNTISSHTLVARVWR